MPRESFVFVHLPGEEVPTVAGRFTYEDSFSPALGSFVYGKSFLHNPKAVPLDPVALPLREEEFRTTLTEGIFGVIRDALPDDWGRHVIQALHGEEYATQFDLLLLPSSDRFGALSFSTDSKSPAVDLPLGHLKDLSEHVLASFNKIDRDIALTETEIRAAIAFGGGSQAGGARPKLTVQDKNNVWLVKLNRHDDLYDAVRVEASMLDLASECGIQVPEHRVQRIADQDVLLVKRFDRSISERGVQKYRAASASSVFRANEEYYRNQATGSYMQLSRELARWGVDVSNDRRQLYRRMVFNCLAGITDDHERNHALIAEGNHFRLAPAYDLAPAKPTTRTRRQSLNVGAFGEAATRDNVLSAVSQFDLTHKEAEEIIEIVVQTVHSRWQATFEGREVSKKDVNLLSACFDHSYFESGQTPRSDFLKSH
jgi:serine/threonine-protein kinase HipA